MFNAAPNQTSDSRRPNLLKGSHRSAVIGNDRSARFFVDVPSLTREAVVDNIESGVQPDEKTEEPAPPKLKAKPKRFENYSPKRLTAEDIRKKQELAAERKQKHDEMKAKQAKKVSEEAIRFDKKVKAHNMLRAEGDTSNKKWYSSAMKF